MLYLFDKHVVCLSYATNVCLQDVALYQTTRDAVASTLNEHKIDISRASLCVECNAVDLFGIL